MASHRVSKPRGSGGHPASRLSPSISKPLPVDDLYPLYPEEWVLVRITATDEVGASTHGEVVAHSLDRGKITKALLEIHRQDSRARTLIFCGGELRVSPEEWRELLAGAAARGPLNAWW